MHKLCTIKEILEKMAHLPDETVFRWFQFDSTETTLCLTLGQMREESNLRSTDSLAINCDNNAVITTVLENKHGWWWRWTMVDGSPVNCVRESKMVLSDTVHGSRK
jgi:hypothetical protein